MILLPSRPPEPRPVHADRISKTLDHFNRKNVGLVLPGGGANGSFQASVLEVLFSAGLRWGAISGVSVGALNGSIAAMQSPKNNTRLVSLWREISANSVYSGKGWEWWSAIKILLGLQKSIYDTSPLRKMIEEHVRAEEMSVPLYVGATDLDRAHFDVFTPDDPGFMDAVLASASIPCLFPPVEIGKQKNLLDGGVMNMAPLSTLIKNEDDVDAIIVVMARPVRAMGDRGQDRSFFEIARRTLDVMMDEVFHNDLSASIRINRMIGQAEQAGVTLRRTNGEAYRHIPIYLIGPDRPFNGMLDFSDAEIRYRLLQGRKTAARFLLDPDGFLPPGQILQHD